MRASGSVTRQDMYCQNRSADTSASPLFRRVATVPSCIAVGIECDTKRTSMKRASGA